MTETPAVQVLLDGSTGSRIRLLTYAPQSAPRGIIHVLHGLGEHAERYAGFAHAANAQGLAVYAHDHRGHGPLRDTPGYFGGKGAWQYLVDDSLAVQVYAEEQYPGLPLVMLGHSMGSYIAQYFAMQHGARLSGLLLSACNWPSRAQLMAGNLLAREECLRLGERHYSPLLDKLGFGAFNRRFEPARTPLDWLSRDEVEVDRYISDPLCGGPFTTGLWRELTGGLLKVAADNGLNRIPAELPILITGGADDPGGGDKGMGKLALHYAQTGHQRLKVKIYPGARHEMLNETNRDEATADWLAWIEQQL